jgi:glyoxylase-like metal-dependent hydrolase (beta-lactamase superfamily II)
MGLAVETIITGQLGANCYLVYDQTSLKALIIDPGDDAIYIMQYIKDLALIPQQIIATHGHFDHVMAVSELQLSLNLPFLINEADLFLLKRMQHSAKHFTGDIAGLKPQVDQTITPGKDIILNRYHFHVIAVPGHTPGSITLHQPDSAIAFVGDTIFSGGAIGRYDFEYSDAVKLAQSVNTLLKLPPETTLYPGHGPRTTVTQENLYHRLSTQ